MSYQYAPQQTATPLASLAPASSPWDQIECLLGNAAFQDLMREVEGQTGLDSSLAPEAGPAWGADLQAPELTPPGLPSWAEARDLDLDLPESVTEVMRSEADKAADPETQASLLQAGAEIPNQDIIYEQLAHNLAYGRSDPGQLKAWGYGPPEVVIPVDPVTGMYLVAVRVDPTLQGQALLDMQQRHGRDLRSVLCFRGSQDAVDWADDVSPEGVGEFQFSAHQGEIAGALAEYADRGPPDVVGHSLGGALAQLACTVGSVSRCVTFQSPGVGQEAAAQAEEAGVEATHHRAAWDGVSYAGEDHIDGEVYIHDTDQEGNTHSHFLLGGINDLRGGEVPEVYNDSVYTGSTVEGEESRLDPAKLAEYERYHATDLDQGATDWNANGQADPGERAFEEGRQQVAEGVRVEVGNLGRAGDHWAQEENGSPERLTTDIANGMNDWATNGAEMNVDPLQMERYIQVWSDIEKQQAAGTSEEELHARVDASGLEPRLVDKMHAQITQLGSERVA